MATPEVHRSGHTPVSPDHAGEIAGTAPDVPPGAASGGPVPPDNRPGHHPPVEQDKPRRRPPSGRRARGASRPAGGSSRGSAARRASGAGAAPPEGRPEAAASAAAGASDPTAHAAGSDAARSALAASGDAGTRTFDFAFEPRLRPLSLLAGVTPGGARVEVDDHLTVRFGRWTLRTPLANVAAAHVTGPYTWWKVAGPAHLSLADGGITFATTTAGGVCISFHEPVPALVPGSMVRHPAATVTVREPQALVAALEDARLRLLAAPAAS